MVANERWSQPEVRLYLVVLPNHLNDVHHLDSNECLKQSQKSKLQPEEVVFLYDREEHEV